MNFGSSTPSLSCCGFTRGGLKRGGTRGSGAKSDDSVACPIPTRYLGVSI
jgi:hypothetical protein